MHFGRAAQRVDNAGELDQQAVAGGLDEAAFVRRDLGIDQLAAVRLEPCEGPFLVGADQPAVTRDICAEDGGQSAFDAFQTAALPNRMRTYVRSGLS